MKVECPSCGSVVEIPAFPGWCPKCSQRIATIVPLLTSTTPRPSTAATELPEEEVVQSSRVVFSPVRESAGSSNLLSKNLVRAVLIALACFVGVFVLIDYVFLKSRAIVSSKTDEKTSSTQTVESEPPAPTPDQPPQPEPPIFVDPIPPSPPAVAPPPPPAPTTTTAPVTATQPAPAVVRPVLAQIESDGVTDKAINDSIQRGVSYLIEQMQGQKITDEGHRNVGGVHALCTLALLHAGEATFDERLSLSGEFMRGVLQQLKDFDLDTDNVTYARSLRAAALAQRDRKEDRETLADDLQWLLKASVKGGYSYTMAPEGITPEQYPTDNSNSQYGALGVWAAADAGLTVPPGYWTDVQQYWTRVASPSGGWGYHPGSQATLSMTSAGLTMMFVARDQLNEQRAATTKPQADPFPEVVNRGLKWLSSGDNSIADLGRFPGYTLYGLERAGLASGFKMFGRHDWYRELSARVLKEQQDNGSWGTNVETAFRLLFLSRGRHPILMNKLRFDGPWANRPRDLVRLTKFVFSSIERPLNWQVINLSDPWETWMDAPIVYLASHEPIELTDEHCEKLRQFTANGGLLFTHADADSRKFNEFAHQLAARLYPQFPIQPLPPEHVIHSSMYTPKQKIPLEGVSNGVRLLMVHSPTDLATKWQYRDERSTPPHFQAGANLFIYATGKHPLRNRLDTPIVPEVRANPIALVDVARVKHAGAWDPEPAAWPRFARWFQAETSIRLTPTEMSPTTLSREVAPVAHLTSSAVVTLPEPELQALRGYVDGGGVLLIDACGGSLEVAKSLRENVLAKLFPQQTPTPLADDHPLLAGKGERMDRLERARLRVFAVERQNVEPPSMQIVEAGKGVVIFSDLDLTSGLLGTTTWGIAGYEPAYAQSFLKNLVLWATLGRGEPLVTPAALPAAAPAPETPPATVPAQ